MAPKEVIRLMDDTLDWLSLAETCRSLAEQAGDETAAQSFNRLATQYEIKAEAHRFLMQAYSRDSTSLHSQQVPVQAQVAEVPREKIYG